MDRTQVTIPEVLHHWATHEPDTAAFIFVDSDMRRRVLTRADVYRFASRFAAILRRNDVKPGDIICNTLPNSPERVVTDLGIMMAGATAMNGQIFLADGEDFIGSLKDSECKAVILDPLERRGAAFVLSKLENEQTNDGRVHFPEVPALRTLLECCLESQAGQPSFLDTLKNEQETFVSDVTPDDLAYVMSTSGSTGFSKLLSRTHARVCNMARNFASACGIPRKRVFAETTTAGLALGDDRTNRISLPVNTNRVAKERNGDDDDSKPGVQEDADSDDGYFPNDSISRQVGETEDEKNTSDPSVERQAKGTNSSQEHQAKDANSSQEQQAKDTNSSQQHQAKDTNSSQQHQAKDTNSSKEHQAKDTNSSQQHQAKDTNSSQEHQAKDTNSSKEHQAKDTNSSQARQAKDRNSSQEQQAKDTNNSQEQQAKDTNRNQEQQAKDTNSSQARQAEETSRNQDTLYADYVYFNNGRLGWSGGFPGEFLWYGATRVLLDLSRGPPEDPVAFSVALAMREGCHYAFFLPFHLQQWLARAELWRGSDFKFKVIGLAGQPVHKSLLQHPALTSLCQAVNVFYGSTDLGCLTCNFAVDPEAYEDGNNGKPFPGVELKIVDEELREIPQDRKFGEELREVPQGRKLGEELREIPQGRKLDEELREIPQGRKLGEKLREISQGRELGEELREIPQGRKLGEELREIPQGRKLDEELRVNPQGRKLGEKLREIPQGRELGEVLVRSDMSFSCYLGNEDATKKTILPDGWCRSGDVGYISEEGDLFVICRSSFAVMRGAYVVYPGWLENRIKHHPAVRDVFVVPVPDPVLHQELCACVVTHPEAEVTVEDLRAFCEALFLTEQNDHMTPVPRYFLFFSDFPTTATGKPCRRSTAATAVSRLLQSGATPTD